LIYKAFLFGVCQKSFLFSLSIIISDTQLTHQIQPRTRQKIYKSRNGSQKKQFLIVHGFGDLPLPAFTGCFRQAVTTGEVHQRLSQIFSYQFLSLLITSENTRFFSQKFSFTARQLSLYPSL
jgi:hypothetical protein